MPTIPRLGVGLWPLLQLVVLTPLTIMLASRFALRARVTPVARDPGSP